jgi:hypothetical protein
MRVVAVTVPAAPYSRLLNIFLRGRAGGIGWSSRSVLLVLPPTAPVSCTRLHKAAPRRANARGLGPSGDS